MDGRVRGGRGMASREVSVILGLAAGLVGSGPLGVGVEMGDSN